GATLDIVSKGEVLIVHGVGIDLYFPAFGSPGETITFCALSTRQTIFYVNSQPFTAEPSKIAAHALRVESPELAIRVVNPPESFSDDFRIQRNDPEDLRVLPLISAARIPAMEKPAPIRWSLLPKGAT